ncbi:TPA: oxidoreductase [Vibrio mimicus]
MRALSTFFLVLLTLLSNKVFADEPILTLTHQGQQFTATYQELLARSDLTITTETPWTQGSAEFKGISAQALLTWLGVKQADLKVTALNKYWAIIPYSDIQKYNPVFAIQKNGKPMAIRDRGPIWSIYPLTSSKELDNEILHSRMVWQISSIDVISQ